MILFRCAELDSSRYITKIEIESFYILIIETLLFLMSVIWLVYGAGSCEEKDHFMWMLWLPYFVLRPWAWTSFFFDDKSKVMSRGFGLLAYTWWSFVSHCSASHFHLRFWVYTPVHRLNVCECHSVCLCADWRPDNLHLYRFWLPWLFVVIKRTRSSPFLPGYIRVMLWKPLGIG